MIRRIINIDEEKCNGCGACANACHEGAITMVNGKAKLLRDDYCEMRGHYNHDKSQENIAEKVKNSAYEIIAKKRATYYGVAMAVKRICEAIIRDEKSILPISSIMHGEFGIDDVVLSMPSIVGANGIETKVPISLSEDEEINLKKSADTLRSILDDCEI
jgi:L-lactate dehydrogenase